VSTEPAAPHNASLTAAKAATPGQASQAHHRLLGTARGNVRRVWEAFPQDAARSPCRPSRSKVRHSGKTNPRRRVPPTAARSLAALKRPVAADVRTPREQQDEPLVLPARSPNLNAYAERWVRSGEGGVPVQGDPLWRALPAASPERICRTFPCRAESLSPKLCACDEIFLPPGSPQRAESQSLHEPLSCPARRLRRQEDLGQLQMGGPLAC
jgi:hypothetical protein